MPIFQSLGAAKAAALPAFHALSRADNTGSFSGKENWHAGKSSVELMKMSLLLSQTLEQQSAQMKIP